DGTTHPLYSFLTTSRAAMRLPEGSLRTRQAGSRVEVAAAPSAAAAYRLNHAHTCHFHVTHFPFQGRGFWPCVRFAFVCERPARAPSVLPRGGWIMFEDQQRDAVEALMKADAEFRRLYQRHRELNSKVDNAEIGVLPVDDMTLSSMKKEKLHIKERLQTMWDHRQEQHIH